MKKFLILLLSLIVILLSSTMIGCSNTNTHSIITISDDGYWVIDGTKTFYKAIAQDGEKGEDGRTPLIEIKDGYWYIDGENTGVIAEGKNGVNGKNGKDAITPKFRINYETTYWEISYDNGKTWISLYSTSQGMSGKDGVDGITPHIGEDGYWYIGSDCTNIPATTFVGYTEVGMNWSTVQLGDIVAFDFKPHYSAYRSYDNLPRAYEYQYNDGIRYIINTYNLTLDGKTILHPNKGASDRPIYSNRYYWSCVGKITAIEGTGYDSDIYIEILYAKYKEI